MTSQNAPTADQMVRSPTVEKRFAVAEVAAPLVTAGLMPFVDPHTADTVATFLAAPLMVGAATATGLLSERTLHAVPAGDILHAHRVPFLVSAITAETAAITGALHGLPGIDALLAGFMTMPSLSGIVSCAWWAAAGFVGFSLRKILGSTRPQAPVPAAPQPVPVDDILQRWHDYISGPNGRHPGQHLSLIAQGREAWEAYIEAQPGEPVTVAAETVSSVYRVPTEWVHITDGPHAGSKHIQVRLVAPSVQERQYGALEALWLKRVARSGGCVPGTHLEGAVADPATGGIAAWIVADEDTDTVTIPEPHRIAGALRTTTLLVSVEPTQNPRKAKLRLMNRSPLEDGKPLTDPEALRANDNGFVQLGTGVSGRPARIQLYDPKGGARHVLIAGVTGSGKGGVLQIICLSYHVNRVAILYADPKGSSNPDVEDMAAYAGTGRDGAMGTLRLAYAILQHRIAQSARLRMKNFQASDDMPFIAVVLDEFAQLLSDKSPFQEEASMIVAALAEQGRSLGIILVLCGQILNLDKMGSDTSIRDNVFYGGALILLRSDGGQKNRLDLPDAFDGIDPSKIPAFWRGGDDETLIYDPTIPEDDPSRTFGVGYTVGPDERAEMMRAWILESSAGMFDPEQIVHPADFPGWDDRDLIAATPAGDSALAPTDDDSAGTGWMPNPVTTSLAKEPTAEEKILHVLAGARDPIGLEVIHLHLDDLAAMTGVTRKTVENTCSRMAKAGTVVRERRRPGPYGLPIPEHADAELATAGQ